MQDYHWFLLFITANCLLLLSLTVNVSRLRLKYKISYGDGGNKQLMNAIRVHSNGTEQVPIYALGILALTFFNTSNTLLSLLTIVFTLSRIIHAYGMLFRSQIMRQLGAGVTYISQGAVILILLLNFNT